MDDELSFADVIDFVKESWKLITSFTALGIAASTLFFLLAPKEFEVKAQIKVAQIRDQKNMVINIEAPESLISRMAFPTSYPKETITLCGFADEKDAGMLLAKKVKLSILRQVEGIVLLQIPGTSKAEAEACVYSVYQLIKTSQAQIAAPYIQELKKKLSIEKKRLADITQVISGYDKNNISINYLLARDEIRYVADQMSSLQNAIIFNENQSRTANFITPIFIGEEPVYPQWRKILLIGLLLGSFSGLFFALARKLYRSNQRS